MKAIFRVFIFSVSCLLFADCSDFLKENVNTTYNQTLSINTRSSLEANVFGCYRQLAVSGFKTGAFCEWLAPASGLAHWGNTTALTNPLERWSCCLKFTRFSQHPEGHDSFASFYKAIYRCNSLLSLLPLSPVDDPYKKEIEGEVHFIRAMAYFYLVRLYGDVTLTTVPPKNTDDNLYAPRTDFWVVYEQIVKDLDIAAAQTRSYERMIQVTGGNGSGRVCNYAAIACRSLVYLTIGTLLAHPDDNFWVNRTPDFSEIGITSAEDAFKLALADAEDVLENGPFELCPDYRQLFRWTEPQDWQLKERIWVMPRSPESSDSGSALTMWALPDYYMNTSHSANYGRCRPDRWFFQKWCERYGGAKGTSANNKDIYVSCPDPRFSTSFIFQSYRGQDNSTLYVYPANARMYPTNDNLMKHYGLPYYKKYYDPTYDNSMGYSDLYVMRLAEVYLIAAESCANLSEVPGDSYGMKAVGYVNVILDRARKSVDGTPAAQPRAWASADFETRDDLINGIFWERCFEMSFEHHEYFDTHRMGAKWLTDNIAKPKNKFLYLKEQDDFEVDGQGHSGYRTMYYGSDFKYDEDWTLVRKGLICGYPYKELIYNPCLDMSKNDPNNGQNPEEVFWR